MQTAHIRSDEGFTLLDVIVAAGLLATALVSLATLSTLAIHANRASGDLTRAAILAQQKLEALRAPEGPPPPADGVERLEYLDYQGRLTSSAAGAAVFVRRWRVDPVPGTPLGAALLRVDVTRAVPVPGTVPASVAGVRRPAS